jgi:uncharacterized protein YpiB (UPF0302 family)
MANDRQIIKDDKLFEWINSFVQQQTQQTKSLSMSEITGDENIMAFHQNELGSANDIGYSFIEDSANDMMATAFEMLDGSNKDKLRVPGFTRMEGVTQNNNEIQNTNSEKEMRKKTLDNAYDNLMKARQEEMMNNPMNQRI